VTRSSIAIVGAGRLGWAIASSLRAGGYRITEIISRPHNVPSTKARSLARSVGAIATRGKSAALDADVVWFCVPDAEIASAGNRFSSMDWRGKVALHSSGVLSSDALLPLRKRGASIASMHPLMTFVRGEVPDLTGVPFAIEGDRRAVRVARKIARDLGGMPVPIRPGDKVPYHAFATMVCPLLISLLAASEKAAMLAGLSAGAARRRMLPILRQTLANYEDLGAAKSFTGPIVRGDSETIRRHLKVLAATPDVRDAYRALAQSALRNLPNRNAEEVQPILRSSMTGNPASSPKLPTAKAPVQRRKAR
jgi:predicted short-subunit dehydrogenase-like oxidoreductase (DUF2520 family)